MVRASVVDWVEDAGFETVAAANADEAISILENRSDIRVVFTDIDMPGSMDGLKLVRGPQPLASRQAGPDIRPDVAGGRGLA